MTADEPSNWFSGFTIDKGKNSGLEVEQTVISSDGFLIGKISKVGTNWADVETIIDPGFSAGAMVERSKDLGLLKVTASLDITDSLSCHICRATQILKLMIT